MIQLYDGGAYLVNGTDIVPEQDAAKLRQLTGRTVSKEEGRKGIIAYSILKNHNTSGSMEHLKIKFDAMASHRINKSVDVQLNLYNLFDKEYVAAINKSGYRYTPGIPRSARLTANFAF